MAPSTTAPATDALRSRLEAILVEAALAAHYREHPAARPSPAELAMAAAEMDGNPLAATPESIRAAAHEVVARHPGAGADDVLLWAEAKASTAA